VGIIDSAPGLTNGGKDFLLMGLDSKGNTKFVEYAGSTITEEPGDIVYNPKIDRFLVVGSTSSPDF